MSLRGGFNGSDGNEFSSSQGSSHQNLLNTPLANTMKKVGLNPQFNNKLNQYVVKKGANSGTQLMSGQASPTSRDGTGGPQGSMYPQFSHLMPHQTSLAKTTYQANTFDQFSQFGGDDDYMFPRGEDVMGSPRTAFYGTGGGLIHHDAHFRQPRFLQGHHEDGV